MAAPPTARRKLLDTAAELFYREGITATGVDRISAAAGVSKRSLYQHFDGKDALVAAALADHGAAIVERYIPTVDNGEPPRQKILGVFEAMGHWSAAADFRGCPFVNVAAELTDAHHPARAVARDYKRQLREYFAHQGRAGGATDPEVLAERLQMVFDGAIVQALINDRAVPESTRGLVEIVLKAHGLPD
jgi:AcrR family transcriptional regulator